MAQADGFSFFKQVYKGWLKAATKQMSFTKEFFTVTTVHGRKVRQTVTALDSEKRASPQADIRRNKVLGIRRHLAEGKYDINRRLNVVLDKILKNLVKW
jgi:hypothetical protein